MKKQRILSLALATTMVLSSMSFNTFAEDQIASATQVVSSADQTISAAALDVAASGSSVQTQMNGGLEYAVTAPWKATVSGDSGGAGKVDGTEVDATGIPFYRVVEDGNTVNTRMGLYYEDTGKWESTGKISTSSDGLVMYYQDMKAEDNFTLKATAHINRLDVTNNQVSFGLFVKDEMQELTNYPCDSNLLVCGPVQLKNGAEGSKNPTVKSYYRTGKTLVTANQANSVNNQDLAFTDPSQIPAEGIDVDLKLVKSGNVFTLTYGDLEPVVLGETNIAFTDDIYVGLAAVRAADITWSNVKLLREGEVDLGEWTVGGAGLLGNPDKAGDYSFTSTGAGSFQLMTNANNAGKIAGSEDSFGYYALDVPSNADFELSADVNVSINTRGNSNPQQTGAGMIVFDEPYVKDTESGAGVTRNNIMLTSYAAAKGDTTASFVARMRNGGDDAGSASVSDPLSDPFPITASNEGPFALNIKKAGDKITVSCNGKSTNFTSSEIFTNETLQIGFFVARDAILDVTNMEFKAEERIAKEVKIITPPNKTEMPYDTDLNLEGIEVQVTYSTGAVEITNLEDLNVTGYDSKTLGAQTITISRGSVSDTLEITVVPKKVTNIALNYAPIKDTFYVGTLFTDSGLDATVTFEDGTTDMLSDGEYKLLLDGKVIDNDTYITADMVGEKTVELCYADSDIYAANNVFASFVITVINAEVNGISVYTPPVKTVYYVGDDIDMGGMVIYATLQTDNGPVVQVIRDNEYTVTGFDSSKAGNLTLTASYNRNPALTTTFNVTVVDNVDTGLVVDTYPRLTFAQNELFDASGLKVGVQYSNGDIISVTADDYYYVRRGENQVDYFTLNNGVVTNVDAAVVNAAPYYIDVTNYNSAPDSADANATTKTSVVIKSEYDDITLNLSIVPVKSHTWKASIFGASSTGVATSNGKTPSSSVTLNYSDGSTASANGDLKSNVDSIKSTDGTIPGVDSINLTSWDGSGKISGDQDGIAYYYTRVNPNNNFTLSADVTVNRFIRDVSDPEDAELVAKAKKEFQDIYDNLGINHTVTDEEALDMVRSGQESFGIMARDAMPLYSTNPSATSNAIVTNSDYANLDENNEPINIYEAYAKGLNTAKGEQVSDANVASVFASNVVVGGGYIGSTYSRDVLGSSFYKNSNYNRINLYVRKGVTAIDGGGTKVGPYNTTDATVKAGEKYKLTLKKINYGYALTTYNYQTDETRTVYSFDTSDDIAGVLTTQDPNNIWVGFYACRFADVNVENVELYETDTTTDPVVVINTDDTYGPKITVVSPLYTNSTNYTLLLKSNNPAGGLVTIKQNDKVVYEGATVNKRATSYPVTLVANSANQFTVSYTPSKADDCSSYDDVVSRFTVVHKEIDSTDDVIYAGPNGSVNGDGTRANPFDLETAFGFVTTGQTIMLLDGTYNINEKISLNETQNGTLTNNIKVFAEEGANPVIDLRSLTGGISSSADYWHFKGITICNSAANSKPFELGGNNNTIEDCTFHDNGDSGFQISRVNTSSDQMEDWPSGNLVLNCESYNNCDPSKNNADGFAIKLTVGVGNMFKGCISHHNLDDGWDMYTKLATGPIGATVLEDCITYRQGFELLDDGTDVDWNATSGGNGFKLGGENIAVTHYLKGCKTFGNKASGVDSNFNPAMKMRNVVAYKNGGSNFKLYSDKHDEYDYDMEGVISYQGTLRDAIGSLTHDATFENASENALVRPDNFFIYGFSNANYPDETTFANGTSEIGGNGVAEYNTVLSYEFFKNAAAAAGYSDSTLDMRSFNSEGVILDDSTIGDYLKSIDTAVSLGDNYRYTKSETGEFIVGDFLSLTKDYVYNEADIPTVPDNSKENTEATTAGGATEATTTSGGGTGGGGGGGGGGGTGGSSSANAATTTEATTEKSTAGSSDEVTTTAKPYFVTNSGLTITPAMGDKDVNFDDIANRAWAVDAINNLAKAGVINGVGNSKFAPDAFTKRADYVVMLVNALGLTGSTSDNFDDVDSSKYYASYIAIAKACGLTTGYGDGNFGPENNITRQDMMVLIAKAYEIMDCELNYDEACLADFADGDQVADYARKYVAALVNANAVAGSEGNINPTALITRAQTAVLMNDVFNTAKYIANQYMADLAEETTVETTEEGTEETTEVESEEGTTVEEESTEVTTEAK